MLAGRLPTILPRLTLEESIETSRVWSVLGKLGAGLPLSVASAGDLDGDGFDDLLVSAGGNAPRVDLFRGRESWVEPDEVLGSRLSQNLPGPASDGELPR